MSLLLRRKDEWIPKDSASKIYDIPKFTNSIEKDRILKVIKKMILCTNYMSWHSNSHIIFLILSLILITNCTSFLCKLLVPLPGGIFQHVLFFWKLIILNFIPIPFIVFFYFSIHVYSVKAQKLMEEMATFLLTQESMCSQNVLYSTDMKFEIYIKPNMTKPIQYNDELVKISYIINFPYDIHDKFYCDNLLNEKEKVIVQNIISYSREQILGLRTFFLSRFIFPFLIVLCYYAYVYPSVEHHTMFYSFACFIIVGIMLAIIGAKMKNKSKKRLEEYLHNVNEKILLEGFYIKATESLISVFVFERNCIKDEMLIQKYLWKVFYQFTA